LNFHSFAPEGATKVELKITLAQYGVASGSVFIDDVIMARPGYVPEEPEPEPLPGQLSIVNPGFEDGSVTGWSLWPASGTHQEVVTDVVLNGSSTLKMVGASVAVYQGVSPIEPGKTYIVNGLVMNPSSDPLQEGQEMRMEITFFDASWTTLLQVYSDPLTSESIQDEIQVLSVSAECPEGVANINMAFNWVGSDGADASTPGSAYCDDMIAFMGAIPAEITNLSLEEDEDFWSWDVDGGWATWCYEPGNDGVVIDATVSHTGDRSAKIFAQDWDAWGDPWWWGGYWGGMNQCVMQDVAEGDCYYTSAWIMTPATDVSLTGNVEIYTEMKYKDDGDSDIIKYVAPFKLTPSSTKDTWHHVQVMGPAVDANTAWIECNVYMGQYGEAGGVAYFDDFRVVHLGGDLPPDVAISAVEEIPDVYSLSQNYPNPFNPTTTIKYSLPEAAKVTVSIYDLMGRLVEELVDNSNQQAGYYTLRWDASNVASGMYIYRIQTANGEFHQVKKCILLK